VRTSGPEAAPTEEAPGPIESLPRRSGVLPRRLMWWGLATALLALPFLSAPGRYVADSRDAVWFQPWTYLSHAFSLWQQSPYLGHEQVDGLIFPMGPVLGILRSVGLSVWATERIWHGLLLLVAAGGTILLVDRLRGTKTVLVPLAAALVYALTPYTFGYGLPTTGAFLPYVLLPVLLLVTTRGLREPSLAGPALFGLVTLSMGGGNGAPQLYAIGTTLAFVLWVVFVERTASFRKAFRFLALAGGFTAALNAYWLIPLVRTDFSNLIAFSEPSNVINVASSFSESIRGLGLWLYYGGDQFGPWVGGIQRFITSPWFVLASFIIPIGALLSAWLARWRLRLFFLFLLILSVVVMTGAFPVTSPTPFGHLLLSAYRHIPGTEGLRTTYKFGGTLNLALAILVAVGLEWGWVRAGSLRRRVAVRSGLACAVVVAIAANAFPLWSGQLYHGTRSTGAIPRYWVAALHQLEMRQGPYRTFFAPGSPSPIYRWGAFHDGLPEASPSLASVHPISLPLGARYGSNLLAAGEQPYQQVRPSSNEAVLLRYLGVNDVVLQNDLDWQRAHTARPAEMQALARDPSLKPLTTFGSVGENVTAPIAPGAADATITRRERALTPVQVLAVPDPLPVVRAQAGPPVLLSGDGFGIAAAAAAGQLEGNPPVVYSGDLTPVELRALLAQNPRIVITDSNRRRLWSFSALRRNFSYVLPAEQTLGASTLGFGLFGDRQETQTVAVYEGVRSISASAYGSPLADEPEVRPAAAFDGDPNTSWLVGGLANPVGESLTVTFSRPRTLSQVELNTPDPGFGRRVRRARVEFSDGSSVLARVRQGRTALTFPPRLTSFVRVRITAVTTALVDNAVGFDEVKIPDVSVREVLRVPTDLLATARAVPGGLDALARAPLTYAFDRSRTDAPLSIDEEVGLQRLFDLPAAASLALGGMAHLDPAASDQEIDRLVRGHTPVRAFSSSRLLDAPNLRASMVLDGDPKTAWIPKGTVGEWFEVHFPERRLHHLSLLAQTQPGRQHVTRVSLTFSDGSSVSSPVNPFTGEQAIHFSPRSASSIRVKVRSVVTVPGQDAPIGIAELRIPGVSLPKLGREDPVHCYLGSAFTVDGTDVPVQLKGNVGDVLAGRNLPVSTCSDVPVSLGSGSHELFARGTIQPDELTLSTPETSPSAAPAPALTTTPQAGSGFDVEIRGSTAPFYLAIGQSWSPRWTASIDGRDLGAPLVLDGYSAGWWVQRTGSYRIEVRYGGQGAFNAALVISALSLVLALAILVRTMRQRRQA
jgi:arabinofuranan 3-O-arabinosyltransferase